VTRLLVVFPGATSPPRDGASAFVSGVLRVLRLDGHELELVVPSLLEPVEPPEATYGVTATWIRLEPPAPSAAARVRRTARAVVRSRPAWVETFASSATLAAVSDAARRAEIVVGFGASAPAILEAVDAPSLLLLFSLPHADSARTGGSWLDRRIAHRFEASLPRRHDVVALTTPAERDVLAARAGVETTWLPFPRSRAVPADRAGGRPRLLYIADWNYPPNAAGLEFLLERVMAEIWEQHPEVELVLAGKGSETLDVAASGPVRTWGQYGDVAEVADTETIAVLPLLAAGGVRTRLLELLDAGLPVVATREAAAGAELAGTVTANAETFAARLLELLDAPERVRELRTAARTGGGWPSDEEVAAAWRAAFELAARRRRSRGRSS
jgi:glycosyltransferase involved in cell wall biosynthesis